MEFGTIVDALTAVGLLALGAYLLRNAAVLADRPRRGTEMKLSRRGYRLVGLALLLVALVNVAQAMS